MFPKSILLDMSCEYEAILNCLIVMRKCLDCIELAEDYTQLLVVVDVALELLRHPPTNALNTICFMTSIKLLHVSASGVPFSRSFFITEEYKLVLLCYKRLVNCIH